jgi:hypothetical protein
MKSDLVGSLVDSKDQVEDCFHDAVGQHFPLEDLQTRYEPLVEGMMSLSREQKENSSSFDADSRPYKMEFGQEYRANLFGSPEMPSTVGEQNISVGISREKTPLQSQGQKREFDRYYSPSLFFLNNFVRTDMQQEWNNRELKVSFSPYEHRNDCLGSSNGNPCLDSYSDFPQRREEVFSDDSISESSYTSIAAPHSLMHEINVSRSNAMYIKDNAPQSFFGQITKPSMESTFNACTRSQQTLTFSSLDRAKHESDTLHGNKQSFKRKTPSYPQECKRGNHFKKKRLPFISCRVFSSNDNSIDSSSTFLHGLEGGNENLFHQSSQSIDLFNRRDNSTVMNSENTNSSFSSDDLNDSSDIPLNLSVNAKKKYGPRKSSLDDTKLPLKKRFIPEFDAQSVASHEKKIPLDDSNSTVGPPIGKHKMYLTSEDPSLKILTAINIPVVKYILLVEKKKTDKMKKLTEFEIPSQAAFRDLKKKKQDHYCIRLDGGHRRDDCFKLGSAELVNDSGGDDFLGTQVIRYETKKSSLPLDPFPKTMVSMNHAKERHNNEEETSGIQGVKIAGSCWDILSGIGNDIITDDTSIMIPNRKFLCFAQVELPLLHQQRFQNLMDVQRQMMTIFRTTVMNTALPKNCENGEVVVMELSIPSQAGRVIQCSENWLPFQLLITNKDKLSLLTEAMTQIIILRSFTHIDRKTMSWIVPCMEIGSCKKFGTETVLPTDILKNEADGNALYLLHKNFIDLFDDYLRLDDNVINILCMICLLQDKLDSLNERRLIE